MEGGPVLVLVSACLIADIVGSLLAHSLALLSDAAHTLVDLGMLGMTLFAVHISNRPANTHKTYGYLRAAVLVAFVNSFVNFFVLILLSAYIFFEAYKRLMSPLGSILPLPMLVIEH